MKGEWESAAKRWRASVELFRWNATSKHLLGLYYLRLGQLNDAEQHFVQSLALDPEFKATYANLSAALLVQGRHQSARRVAEEGLKRYPAAYQCSYNLGVALALGLFEESAFACGHT